MAIERSITTDTGGEKQDLEEKQVEISNDSPKAKQKFYTPQTDEERALDRKVNFKLDVYVVSILAISFILCGIDKTNVGFVATSSFPEDADLHPDDIPNSLSLFSATYVTLQPVMATAARRVGVQYFIGVQVAVWGGLCMAHAGIQNSRGLIALRLLIGAAEAGFTQIGMYYMSTLYPKTALGFRFGMFAGMYSVAGAFAGLIAYGLLQINSASVHGWQLVFLIEGGITVLVGVAAFFLLPKTLSGAWFLSPDEREHAVHRMELDLAGSQEDPDAGSTDITRRDFIDVVKDWRKLIIVICNITSVLPVTAFTTFLPLVVEGMGYEGIKANLMSVPPFVVGVVGLLIVVTSSDHFLERSLHTVGGMALGIIGLIVMAVTANNQLRYGFAHVCMAGVFIGGPLLAVWLAGNTPWKSTRSVMLGVNGWSNLAGVIAGQMYKSQYAPRYETPLIATMGIMVAGMLGIVAIRIVYYFVNKRRAKTIANWDEQRFEEEARSEKRRGDQRLTFMYGF